MNRAASSGLLSRLLYRAMLRTRFIGTAQRCDSFAPDSRDAIQRIYVINLDRQPQRWRQVREDLVRLRDRFGQPLAAIARRFSAIDARYMRLPQSSADIEPFYTVADQLHVEPNDLLAAHGRERIEMTREEIAVALSHIAIWRIVAASHRGNTLVLEDDVYFRRGFARAFDAAWSDLAFYNRRPDIIYLSYKETRKRPAGATLSRHWFRPQGLWQLSGYVLSTEGARKLVERLPVRGPVDLWINHQFDCLDVLASRTPVVVQRWDTKSGNSYSILPVLSKLGVSTAEQPLLPRVRNLPRPIFAFGERGSGLTALAMALSMLGYRCCSDAVDLPTAERDALFEKRGHRVFDAYVNIGSIGLNEVTTLARIYRKARIIVTNERIARTLLPGPIEPKRVLVLPYDHEDKWELLSRFVGCDYPSDCYPECPDQFQRELSNRVDETLASARPHPVQQLKCDVSPWIARSKTWRGLPVVQTTVSSASMCTSIAQPLADLDRSPWTARHDTFPSNRALFTPRNLSLGTSGTARLTLREERTGVRDYTSAALSTRGRYLFGRFIVEVRPAKVSGVITGVFLHRNSPRQEIDVEFLGRDTTKMLVNVYYNPGDEGSRMEYGYRGTPALIDLGFDASAAFHRYEIEWCPTAIRWRVDGHIVCERINWDPTPVPHLPMNFNVNLWPCRSEELAGKLSTRDLPASTELRAMEIHAQPAPQASHADTYDLRVLS